MADTNSSSGSSGDVEDDTEVTSLLAQSLDPHPSQDSHQAARDLSGVLIARLTVRVCETGGWGSKYDDARGT